MGLLRQCQIFGQIVFVDAIVRNFVLLVFIFVLHVIKCSSSSHAYIFTNLRLIVVGSTWLSFACIVRVSADILDIVVDLTQLVINFLVLCATVDIILDPILLLVGSDLNAPLGLLLLGSSSLSLESGADITFIGIYEDVGNSSRFFQSLSAATILIRVLLSLVLTFMLIFVLNLIAKLHQCLIDTVGPYIYT